ncbi:MAG: LamG-like jellyroll fold domain-containing protein, partial [Candidatus Roizmanbacteria bacterium]
NGGYAYFDDISVTPLDNVALSLKAWTPVADSGGSSNGLSVQGSTTGVASNATGIRNSAYTFDGSSGYLRQATIGMNIGTLTYATGNDTTSAQFEDDGQNFSTYQTTSGDASYMLVVTNSDNTLTWGYLGTASGTGNKDITIYTTKARATRGWGASGSTLPIGGSKVPVGYEIRKTDFQLSSTFTVGAWTTRNASDNGGVIGKKTGSVGNGFGLSISDNDIRFGTDSYGVSHFAFSPGTAWHFYVVTFSSGTATVYIDGASVVSNGSLTLSDTYAPLTVGFDYYWSGTNDRHLNGSIDEPFVTTEVLTAAQIFDMYNSGR